MMISKYAYYFTHLQDEKITFRIIIVEYIYWDALPRFSYSSDLTKATELLYEGSNKFSIASSVKQRCVNIPCNTSLQVPLCGFPSFVIMVTVYSPLSLITRFLSSRDPVDVKRVILSVYPGPVMFTVLEVIRLKLLPWISEKPQVTIRNGVSGGTIVVVNITVPPTTAVRLSGSTPAPWLTPGGDRCSKFGINLTET